MNQPSTTYNDWLAVSTDGFASMNAGRPPEHLVKELVQNSLDAIGNQPGRIELTIAASDTNNLTVICRDDGCGVANLLDIRTVFWTSKTDSHLQRGRMGRGFKEMLCLARQAIVTSGKAKVQFVIEDGKRLTRQSAVSVPVPGTVVQMLMSWPSTTIAKLESYFQTLLPPANVQLLVNANPVPHRRPVHPLSASLPTELFQEGKWLRPVRKAGIELVSVAASETPTLYEMGIPVCPLDWGQKFHANVLQRVPMNPCRDAVASGYLVKVHRACLPVLLPDMKASEVLQDWVGNAAPGCPKAVQQEVIHKGFGEKIARSVPKMGVRQFDEDARDIGVGVIDTKQTSGGFRRILQAHVPTTRQVVDNHNLELVGVAASGRFDAGKVFTQATTLAQKQQKLVEAAGGKDHVQEMLAFACWFCQQLLDGYDDGATCSASIAVLKPVGAVATWGSDDVLTLGIDTPSLWHDPMGEDSLTTLIHEAAHHQNAHHGRDFHKELERLAGRAAAIMLGHGDHVRRQWPGLATKPTGP